MCVVGNLVVVWWICVSVVLIVWVWFIVGSVIEMLGRNLISVSVFFVLFGFLCMWKVVLLWLWIVCGIG